MCGTCRCSNQPLLTFGVALDGCLGLAAGAMLQPEVVLAVTYTLVLLSMAVMAWLLCLMQPEVVLAVTGTRLQHAVGGGGAAVAACVAQCTACCCLAVWGAANLLWCVVEESRNCLHISRDGRSCMRVWDHMYACARRTCMYRQLEERCSTSGVWARHFERLVLQHVRATTVHVLRSRMHARQPVFTATTVVHTSPIRWQYCIRGRGSEMCDWLTAEQL